MTAVIDTPETPADDFESDNLPIEATAAVYLHWDDAEGRWGIAPSSMDGYPLDCDGDVTTDLCDGYDAHSPAKQAEWDRAAVAQMPTGAELFQTLGLAAVCFDGPTQGLMRQLHVAREEVGPAMQRVDRTVRDDTDDELGARMDAIETLQGALDAAMALLRRAGLVGEDA